MSSSRSTNSPRVKAHKLKVAGTKKQGSPSPKRLKQRKILLSTTEDDDDDLESLSASLSTYGSVGGYSSNIIGSRLEAPSPETNSPQAPPSMMQQYYSAIDTDVESYGQKLSPTHLVEISRLRAQLRAEMEEKNSLAQKVVALTDKLVDAKRSLQDTSAALQKLQQLAVQLMSKKDERESQLQDASQRNSSLQRRIHELEGQLNETNVRELETLTRKNNNNKPESRDGNSEDIQSQLAAAREQIAQLKRENFQLVEDKQDAQYIIEAKTNRINVLEERLRLAESRSMMDWGSMPSASRDIYSAPVMQRGSGDFIPGNPLESKLVMLETDKSMLEQRLALIERQLSHPTLTTMPGQPLSQQPPLTVSTQSSSPRPPASQQAQSPYSLRPTSVERDPQPGMIANSAHAQSAGRIKRVSLPPVIEQHDTQQSPVVASARGPSINQALSGSGDIGEARLAAQMAVMQSTSTAPVVAEEQGVSLAQFRRDQSVLYHEITQQPNAEPLPVAESLDEVKQKLENQKNEAKKAMMTWYRSFVKEHNREPTKEERDKFVGAEYRQFRRSSQSIKELEARK